MGFDANFREEARLRDGRPVVMRFITGGDKETLRTGFDHLTQQSRYFRFLTGKPRLTGAELKYFTEVDGINHVAIVAGVEHADGAEEGYGVARFIKSAQDPQSAEIAIVILDELHGNGLGSLMLQRLAEVAKEHGVTRFTAEFSSQNGPMRTLLERLGHDHQFKSHGSTVEVVLSL